MAERETNKERAAREAKRQGTLKRAHYAAEFIRALKRRDSDLSPTDAMLFFSYIESDENVPRFLRLVADRLEGKALHNPGWNDHAIMEAYKEARRRIPWPPDKRPDPKMLVSIYKRFLLKDGAIGLFPYPSFAEFLNIFWEQNPKLHGASERSLRRSLRRLGYLVRPEKRGRPRAR